MFKIMMIWTSLSVAYVAVAMKWMPWHDFNLSFFENKSFDYEKSSLELARDNRLLKAHNSELLSRVNHLESQNRAFISQNNDSKLNRAIASIPKTSAEDLVLYEVYRWTPEKLLAIGEKELFFKNYNKSAQFYNELIARFPKNKLINDRVLFGAGVAAFESKKNYGWAAAHLGSLVSAYPQSSYYRGAKLWLALSHYNMGDEKKFLETVEEFRQKYRNTEEWKILSKYYEDISYKFKK